MEPRHYPRPRNGLKRASLLGPHWLFRCIRKDPVRHLLPCPDVTPAGDQLFPVPAPTSGGRPQLLMVVAGGTRVSRDDRLSPPGAQGLRFRICLVADDERPLPDCLVADDKRPLPAPPSSSQCSPEGIPPGLFACGADRAVTTRLLAKRSLPALPLSYGAMDWRPRRESNPLPSNQYKM
jgi:hypothetical protein